MRLKRLKVLKPLQGFCNLDLGASSRPPSV